MRSIVCLAISQKTFLGVVFNQSGWRSIVEKMNECDPEIVPEEKINEVVDFLVKE